MGLEAHTRAQHFVDCIISNSAPVVNGSSGVAVVQVLECAQISLREQRPVALAEVVQRRAVAQPTLDKAFGRTPVWLTPMRSKKTPPVRN